MHAIEKTINAVNILLRNDFDKDLTDFLKTFMNMLKIKECYN